MKALEAAHVLHHVGMGEETCQQYQQLAQAIDEFIGKTFNDWVSTVEKELWRYLEVVAPQLQQIPPQALLRDPLLGETPI